MKTGAFALAIIAVALGVWFVLRSGGPTPPSQSDTAAALPDGALVAVAVPASLSDQATAGKQAFDAKCAACHGANAQGKDGVGPPLVHKIYEPSHHGDMAFVLAAQNGVRGHHWNFGDMPPVEGITPAEVLNIVAYVRALQAENGIN